jgi:hypothetical protein
MTRGAITVGQMPISGDDLSLGAVTQFGVAS